MDYKWFVILCMFIIACITLDEMHARSTRQSSTEQLCYEPYSTAVKPEYLVTQAWVTWEQTTEPIIHEGEEVESLVEYEIVEFEDGTEGAVCTIIAPLPTKLLGDPVMDAWGHELLHCLAGDFHPEDN